MQPIEDGMPVYLTQDGSRGLLVVEARRGSNNNNPGQNLNVADAFSQRPDLEIQATRDMGDGEPAMRCNNDLTVARGINGIPTPDFEDPSTEITEAENDHACRFAENGIKISSSEACTKGVSGQTGFLGSLTRNQYCHSVPAVAHFPPGDTILTVRVKDIFGTPGPTAQIKVRAPTPTP